MNIEAITFESDVIVNGKLMPAGTRLGFFNGSVAAVHPNEPVRVMIGGELREFNFAAEPPHRNVTIDNQVYRIAFLPDDGVEVRWLAPASTYKPL